MGKPGFSYWPWKDSKTTLFVQDNEAGYLAPQERDGSCEKGRGPQLLPAGRSALLMTGFLNLQTKQAPRGSSGCVLAESGFSS